MLRATAVVVIVVTILILTALYLPVRQALIRQIDQRFELEAQLIHSTITGYLEHSAELASQIPSRTQIRREMQRYLLGEITIEEYRQFAEPRLTDAVSAAEGIVGVTRVDRSGDQLVVVGGRLRVLESLQFSPGQAEIVGPVVRTGSRDVFVVVAPIRDPMGALLGYDLVSISLASLQQQLSRAARLFDATTATLSRAGETIATAGPQQHDTDLSTVAYRVTSHWDLTVVRPREVLYASAVAFLRRMAIATIAVAAAILLVVHRSQRTVTERARTAELERDVANRRLMMREVHHRIKNDLSLVGSLLSLHQRSSADQAVRAALSEAEHRVNVVSEIYDQLYQTEDFGRVNIREVLGEYLKQFHHVSISLSAEDMLLDRKVAIPVGIIINELVVNAAKYGQPVSGEAKISVQLVRQETGSLRISVRDNGPGFPAHDPAELSGFGLSMVETLASQFDGELSIPETESGGAIEIVLHEVEDSSE